MHFFYLGQTFTAPDLTDGVTTVATIAGLIAAIMAGVIVWRKVAKYFGKSG